MGEAPARCNGEARSRGPSNPGSLRYSWLLTRTKLTLQKMTPPVSAGHSQGRVLTVPNKERKGEADALSPSEPEPGPVGFPTGQADRGECQRQSLGSQPPRVPFPKKTPFSWFTSRAHTLPASSHQNPPGNPSILLKMGVVPKINK